MNGRIAASRLLIKAGQFMQSLPVVIMRPDDLIEFSRQTYATPHNYSAFMQESLRNSGLMLAERQFLGRLPFRKGRVLILGAGGGREAIALAKLGFTVTGVDFIPELIASAREYAAREGVGFEGLVQEISQLSVPENSYDLCWLSMGMYSCVPSRRKRVAMLHRFARALKPEGYAFCQMAWATQKVSSGFNERLKKVIGYMTLGNRGYETGDVLWAKGEFIHLFRNADDVLQEFADGGFDIVHFEVSKEQTRAAVLAQKIRPK